MKNFRFPSTTGLFLALQLVFFGQLLAVETAKPPCLPAPTLSPGSITHVCAGQMATLELANLQSGQEAVWYADPGLTNLLYQDAANLFQPTPLITTTYYGVVIDIIQNCYSETLTISVAVGGNIGIISGNVHTEAGDGIEDAAVSLTATGFGTIMTQTNSAGGYVFSGLPLNLDYKIRVEKDNDPLNGVTTFDLVLMSKHILDIELLNSPYKIIAGDVNGNGVITVADILETRMLILGVLTEFITAPSWRFVPADFTFPDPGDPYLTEFPLGYKCVHLDCILDGQDFIGIKTGDVNLTAVPNS